MDRDASVSPSKVVDEIRSCLRKAKPTLPVDDDFDALSAENRLLKDEKSQLLCLLDDLEDRIQKQQQEQHQAVAAESNGKENGVAEVRTGAEEGEAAGSTTPTKQSVVRMDGASPKPTSQNKLRWSTLEAKAQAAWNSSADGRDPVYVWTPTDVKFTDEKIMSNLQRHYALHLVGFPLNAAAPFGRSSDLGPKVGKTLPTGGADEGRAANTSPAAGAKRNTSPSANRLPPPNVVAVQIRRSTPSRTIATPVKQSDKETPQKSVTPNRTGVPPAKTTPIRRSVTPPAGLKSAVATGSSASAASKDAKATGTADGSKPTLKFVVKQSAPRDSTASDEKNGQKPLQNGSKAPPRTGSTLNGSSGSRAASTAPNGTAGSANAPSQASRPLLGISAVLAQFKNIGPGETPRVPGDKRSPRPGSAPVVAANSSASLKRETKNEVKIGYAHAKPPGLAAASGSTAKLTRSTPAKR